MKVKLIKHYVDKENKQGQPFLDKNGTQKYKVSIQVEGREGKWVSAFVYGNHPALTWYIGTVVDLNFTQNKDGFWNFELTPDASYGHTQQLQNRDELKELREQVKSLELKLSVLTGRVDHLACIKEDFGIAEDELPEGFEIVENPKSEEIRVEDIPF